MRSLESGVKFGLRGVGLGSDPSELRGLGLGVKVM